MLDLHRGVDACAFVLVELLAGFCAGGDEDVEVVCYYSLVVSWARCDGDKKRRTSEGEASGAEDLSVGGKG
jgi:hypothetical protein